LALIVTILAGADLYARGVFVQTSSRTVAPPLPQVAISAPLQRDVDGRLGFLGQFSAVDHLELRAQVGGTLAQIGFKDGDIVHKGDLLFVIDRVPFEIKLAQANVQPESATARLVLANRELARIQMLQARRVETAENLDQRAADQRAAQAAVDDANARSGMRSLT
jgi:multidrug efflux pump subunit AcrA (membrane-fusion protein)